MPSEKGPLSHGITATFGVLLYFERNEAVKRWDNGSVWSRLLKIAWKALVLRLEKMSPKIKDGDQYAYVKGRTTFDAVP